MAEYLILDGTRAHVSFFVPAIIGATHMHMDVQTYMSTCASATSHNSPTERL